MIKKILTLSFFFASFAMFAQECKTYALHWDFNSQSEHLVALDPITGEYEILNSIPNVQYIQHGFWAINPDEGEYYFYGISQNNDAKLYSISLKDGSVANAIDFPPAGFNGNLNELHYHPFTNLLYALHWDNVAEMEFLVSLDPQTGAVDTVAGLPNVQMIQSDFSALDYFNDKYYFSGIDFDNNARLYTIDLKTNRIIADPVFPENSIAGGVNELEIDILRGTLYGLHYDQEEMAEYLIRIYPNSGAVEKMSLIPDVQMIQSGFSALNSHDQQYYFLGINSNNEALLYTIDLSTGATINAAEFATGLNGSLNGLRFPVITPVVSNMSETSICINDSSLIQAPQNFQSYQWSNNSTLPQIYVADSSEYSVVLTKDYGCQVVIYPLQMNLYDCGDIVGTLEQTLDGCYFDSEMVALRFIDEIETTADFVNLRWNFITIELDTFQFDMTYPAQSEGLYQIGIGFNCDNKSETEYFYEMIDIQAQNPTGLAENPVSKNIKVYPNPAQLALNIEMSQLPSDAQVEIYNAHNKLVNTFQLSETNLNKIDIQDLSSGLYILVIRSPKLLYTTKFIKE